MTINNPSRPPDDERPPSSNDPDDAPVRLPGPANLYPHATPPSHPTGGQVPRPTPPSPPPSHGYVSPPGTGQVPGQVPPQPPGTGPAPQVYRQGHGQTPPPGQPVWPGHPAQPGAGHPGQAQAMPRPTAYQGTIGHAPVVAPPVVAPPAVAPTGTGHPAAPPPGVPVQRGPVAPPGVVAQSGPAVQPGVVAQPGARSAPAPSAPVAAPSRVASAAAQPGVQQSEAPTTGAPVDTAATSRIGAPAIVGTRTAEQAAQAAAAAVAYAPAAAPTIAPRPTRTPPTQPTQGTLYGGTGSNGHNGNGRPRSRRTLPGLRVGAHTASDGALALLGMPMPGSGMVLGRDVDSATASIRLFRPEPTRVALVGGEWAFHLLTLRALALGARVAVFTATPERWEGFGEWATGRTGRVATFAPDQAVIVPASAHEPALLLHDGGLTGSPSATPLGPWQTRLTVLRQLTTYGVPALQEASVVLTQRLAKAEADIIASTMRLSSEAGSWMQTLADDSLAVLIGGEERFVRLTLAEVEKQLGAPQR